MVDWINHVQVGDCRRLMRQMIADKVQVQTIVTSPPYWNLRDYQHPGQMGQEPTLQGWVNRMRNVFRLAREVLKNDGTLWLNLGDSYASSGGAGRQGKDGDRANRTERPRPRHAALGSLKAKDLMGQAWRVALALQADGWYLRSCVIWSKNNPMPESVSDRPTTAHEYIFLLSKRPRYFYDAAAVREPVSEDTHARMARNATAAGSTRANGGTRPDRPMKAVLRQHSPVSGWDMGPGNHSTMLHASNGVGFGHGYDRLPKERVTKFKQDGHGRRHKGFNESYFGNVKNNGSFDAAMAVMPDDRNMRTVWTFPTEAFKGAHFATFPRALVERCVLAGSRPGDVVLDIFAGSGTTLEVSAGLGRHYIGLEINRDYVEMFRRHRRVQLGLPFPSEGDTRGC
jgi:site-specific DNA-methyltransferase (cytosine-N4-specific)